MTYKAGVAEQRLCVRASLSASSAKIVSSVISLHKSGADRERERDTHTQTNVHTQAKIFLFWYNERVVCCSLGCFVLA